MMAIWRKKVRALRATLIVRFQQIIGLDSQFRLSVACPYEAPEQIGTRSLTTETYTWEIVIVRPRGRVIGTVEAPDRETAIKIAIEEFKITDPNIMNRLSAQLIG
jgi:hypothetical protein